MGYRNDNSLLPEKVIFRGFSLFTRNDRAENGRQERRVLA